MAFALLLVALTAVTAFSGDSDENAKTAILEQMIVTARATGRPVSQTPGGVGVVESEEIFEQQPVSLTNIITRIPGVNKSSDSAWGSAVNIRGLGRNRVVFVIDGSRVNTATDINAQFGLVNPSDIERIEVVRGPGAAPLNGMARLAEHVPGIPEDLIRTPMPRTTARMRGPLPPAVTGTMTVIGPGMATQSTTASSGIITQRPGWVTSGT